MGVYESIEKAKASGDVTAIRIMMKNSLLADPTFREFDEMVSLTHNMPGLYDSHDGAVPAPRVAWNDEYMNKLMVQVVINFSRERLAHLKDVVSYLRPAMARTVPQSGGSRPSIPNGGYRPSNPVYGNTSGSRGNSSRSYQEQKLLDQMKGRIRPMKIATSAVVGAVVGGVVVGSSSILLGVAVGVGVGLGISTIATRGGR